MKIIITILSSLIFIPILLITLISGSVKFQILDPNFWIKSFEEHGTHQEIQFEVVKYVEEKNAVAITDIITIENVADFTNRNTVRVIRFLNGSPGDLTFYIPIQKIPEGMLPKRLGEFSEEMTLSMLISKFNLTGVDMDTVNKLKNTGKTFNYIFYISFGILLIIAYFASPLVYLFMGIILILQNFLVGQVNLHGNRIIDILFTPAMENISRTWAIVGMVFVIVGIIIFMTKRYIIAKDG